MTYAPARLLEVRRYLQPIVGLLDNELGIAPDAAHRGGYHCGWDRRLIVNGSLQDYSWEESARDWNHTSDAASAFDLGRFDRVLGGKRVTWIDFSLWLVAECAAGAQDTLDIREVIYTPDGRTVRRWDRLGRRSTGDSSHLTHTHISYFRDAEGRDKTGPYRRFFDPLIRRTGMILIKTSGSDAVYVSDGTTYRHLTSGAALTAAQKAGYQLIVVPGMADLEALAGVPATEAAPVRLDAEQLARLTADVSADVSAAVLAGMPRAATEAEVRDAVADLGEKGAAGVRAES